MQELDVPLYIRPCPEMGDNYEKHYAGHRYSNGPTVAFAEGVSQQPTTAWLVRNGVFDRFPETQDHVGEDRFDHTDHIIS